VPAGGYGTYFAPQSLPADSEAITPRDEGHPSHVATKASSPATLATRSRTPSDAVCIPTQHEVADVVPVQQAASGTVGLLRAEPGVSSVKGGDMFRMAVLVVAAQQVQSRARLGGPGCLGPQPVSSPCQLAWEVLRWGRWCYLLRMWRF
jgi:hypothetical protein